MKCDNLVVYRDSLRGPAKKVPYMWFSPQVIADGTAKDIPKEAVKCDGLVKVTGVTPYVLDHDKDVHLDIRYACEKCQAPYFPELPEDLATLTTFLQKVLDEKK